MILNRYNLLKNPQVVGEIIADIGIGFLVNSMFSITHREIDLINIVDVLIGLIMIIEGNIVKYKEKKWI